MKPVTLQIVIEERRTNRAWHMKFGGQSRFVTLSPPGIKKRGRIAKGTEMILPRLTSLPGLNPYQRIALEQPKEKADIRNVVPAFSLCRMADIHRMTPFIKRSI